MIDKNCAEALARARCVLGSDGFAGAIIARGTGEVHGVPVQWMRTWRANGQFAETFDGALNHAAGFDGRVGWRVDETGMPGPLDLGDLEELIVSNAVWTGRWLCEDGGIRIEDTVSSHGSRIVLRIHANADGLGGRRFRLALDARTGLPQTLEPFGRDDVTATFNDFRPGGFGLVPHVTTIRHEWLVNTLRVESIERTTATPACGPLHDVPNDVTFDDAAPPAWRFTRGKLPLVRPLVDGNEVGWFVLDTGAGSLGIDAGIAASLRLPELGRRLIRTSDGVAGAPYPVTEGCRASSSSPSRRACRREAARPPWEPARRRSPPFSPPCFLP